MVCVDHRLSNKEQRKVQRLENEQRRKAEHKKNKTTSGLELSAVSNQYDDNECEREQPVNESTQALAVEGSDHIVNGSKETNRVRGKQHFIDDRMLACMDAGKMSTPFAIHFLTATAKALGHDVQNLVLNCTSLHKQRKEYRQRHAKEIIQNFKTPETFVLHWDGKLLPAMKNKEKVDRLAIVLTSENVEKLIAIPSIEVGTGAAIAQSIYEYLTRMNMPNLLEMVCFDTTSTNTGPVNGAATLLEQKLDHKLLWLPCRHHIAELLLKTVFEHNFGKSSGPEVAIFERFAREWSKIKVNEFSSGIIDDKVSYVLSTEECEARKNMFTDYLAKDHIRHDYKELLQLGLAFLGDTDPNFTFRSPGATSHARFMSKALYSLKMYMFHAQFKMSTSQLTSFRNVCIFLIRIYIPYWFRSINAVEAPNNDLNLIKDIKSYHDSKTSLVLLKKFQNHLWYLSEEAVGLAFFDPSVELNIKKKNGVRS